MQRWDAKTGDDGNTEQSIYLHTSALAFPSPTITRSANSAVPTTVIMSFSLSVRQNLTLSFEETEILT